MRLHFYHNDNLGTPLYLTDAVGTVVWEGEYWPFGDIYLQDTDPDGNGKNVYQPFRFPGRMEGFETGLYYNYFRDYDPSVGRYVEFVGKPSESEPNMYVYTNANPINLIDPLGLQPVIFPDDFWDNLPYDVNFSAHPMPNLLVPIPPNAIGISSTASDDGIEECGEVAIGTYGDAAMTVDFNLGTPGSEPGTKWRIGRSPLPWPVFEVVMKKNRKYSWWMFAGDNLHQINIGISLYNFGSPVVMTKIIE